MDIIPSLQQKVNKIVSDTGSDGSVSTSFIRMVDLGISDTKIDTSRLVSDVLVYVGLLGVKGLVKNETNIKVLINVILWGLYLAWYNRNKFRSRVSGVLRKMGMGEQADNFDRCGEHVYDMACCQCGYVHKVTFHCKLRVCPECGWVRKGALMGAYADTLRSLGRLRFITLTLKNVANLDDGVKRIRACFRKLRHRKGYKVWIKGGLYGIESPIGRDGLWHVHLHIIYAGSWIDQGKLADDWEAITGDSRYVFIQDVKHGRSPIGYILKYVNKHDSIVLAGDDELGEYVSVLRNVRLIQPFGCLLGMKAEKGLFLCPKCGGCVWKVEGMDALVGLVSERPYCRHSDHDDYLATMYKQ